MGDAGVDVMVRISSFFADIRDSRKLPIALGVSTDPSLVNVLQAVPRVRGDVIMRATRTLLYGTGLHTKYGSHLHNRRLRAQRRKIAKDTTLVFQRGHPVHVLVVWYLAWVLS